MMIYFDQFNTIDCDLEQMIRTATTQGAGNKQIAGNTGGTS